jgi:hypothetical protein
MPKVMGASKMLENYHHPDLTWEGMRKRKGRWKDEGEGNRGKGREGKGKEEGKGQGKGSASKMLQNYHHRDLTWEGMRRESKGRGRGRGRGRGQGKEEQDTRGHSFRHSHQANRTTNDGARFLDSGTPGGRRISRAAALPPSYRFLEPRGVCT